MNFSIDATTYQSPNFNDRKCAISILLIHATTSETLDSAAKWLCLPSSEVSTHYIISQTGLIYQLVADAHRAWHAGKSAWHGITDVNSASIGIELENRNDGKDPYSQIQIDTLTYLVEWKTRQYNIKLENIVRHLDVAIPKGRKTDPVGFPWEQWKKQLTGHVDEHSDVWAQWGTQFALYQDEKSFGIPQFWLKHPDVFGQARSNEIWIDGVWSYRAFEFGLIFYLKRTNRVAGMLNNGLAVD